MRALARIGAFARESASALEEWFLGPAEPRAYAGLRIGYALAAFSVLVDFWPLRHVLLATTGIFGGSDTEAAALTNVFRFARSETSVTAVFVVAALAILALGLGFLPRLAALVTYIWVLSYSDTASTALSGFDTILRVVGFVIVVSPQVPTWSVGPAWAKGRSTKPSRYGLRLVQWQLMLIYVCTVWLKAPDEFWRRGEAITYFMMSMFARFPNPAFSHHAIFGAVLTYGTLLIEASLPFLLWPRKTRMLGVALGAALHLGIGFSARLALFTLAMVPLYVSFFEAQDFAFIASWWPRPVSESAPRQT